MLLRRIARWRHAAWLRRHRLRPRRWHRLIEDIAPLRGLDSVERVRLQMLTLQFLERKVINGVQGMRLDGHRRLVIATQACLPILNLDMSYYDGFHEVVVYPAAFQVRQPHTDELGLVSEQAQVLSGQAWQQGPVILSWDDIERDQDAAREGSNVVIHELAHKLDMLSGSANGAPPLHPGMSAKTWSEELAAAYQRLRSQSGHRHTCINPYGATNPAEFFAVTSEYFFTAPVRLQQVCPGVYDNLKAFYRQDPLVRFGHAA